MKSFWRTFPLFSSALPAAVLLFGLVKAFARPEGEAVSAVPASSAASAWRPARGEFLVLALGDSLTRGRGDERGEGYVGAVAQDLRKSRPGLRVENLAIDGLESEGLEEILSHPNPQALAAGAGLILISIGGNDLSHTLGHSLAGSSSAPLGAARERFEKKLDSILSHLRERNASAPILILSLYNPSSAAQRRDPSSAAQRGEPSGAAGRDPSAGLAELGSTVIIEWNAALERIAVKHGARVVPLRDLFEAHPERLSRDSFHPNASGYQLIGRRVLEQL